MGAKESNGFEKPGCLQEIRVAPLDMKPVYVATHRSHFRPLSGEMSMDAPGCAT